MSLVAHYQFLDPSDLGLDSSANGLHATNNNVTQVSDPERGIVASFNGIDSGLESISNIVAPVGSTGRTCMAWVKLTNTSGSGAIMNYGAGSISYYRALVGINGVGGGTATFSSSEGSSGTSANTTLYPMFNVWSHVAIDVTSTRTVKIYYNGVRIRQASIFNTLNTAASTLRVGYADFGNSNNSYFTGFMTDVRLYSGNATGLISSVMALPPNIPFGLTPYSTLVETTWLESAGAVSYRVTVDSGSGEIIAGNNITSTETVLYNLIPLVSYTFRLYYSLDGTNYTLKETAVSTMLENTAANANIQLFSSGTAYDLRVLNKVTRARLERHFNSSLTTGNDIIVDDTRFKGRKLTLVTNGSTSTIPKGNTMIFPFNADDGASQNATIELSDTTNTTVTYDETTNEIDVGGTTYAEGDIFVLDGKKVTVYDV